MTELICTACRTGCRLTVDTDREGGIRVSGNMCSKGEEFGGWRMGSAAAGDSESGSAKDKPVSRTDGRGEGWNNWRDRFHSSREVHEVHDRLKALGGLLKHRRRAISPGKWQQIRAVLERANREIEGLLNN